MKKIYSFSERLSTSKLSILALFFSFFLSQSATAQVDVVASVGTPVGSYTTLTAAFTAINTGTHQGVIGINITGDTNEGATTAILNASGSGAALYSTITISPSGGVARTISGATTAGSPMIDLSGADNVTFDGINSGGNNLIIANTTVSATSGTSTIRFIGGATNNIITNCSIQGSSTMATGTNGGNIYFATDAVTASGNDNNTISNCDIGPVGANVPTKAIYANGSTTTTLIGNSGNIITNNNIHDFFGAAVTSSGISLQGGCNTWTITNNRFYQTTLKTWTTGAIHRGIEINNTTATSGNQAHTITGNTIGFSSNTQTGVYSLTGSTGKFQGIVFNGITGGTISNINNNTVSSVSLTGVTSSGTTTASPFVAILIINGLANSNNNTVGSQVATNSLVYSTTTTSATDIFGIFNFSVDNWTVSNNLIGGMNITNAGASGTFVLNGIRVNTGTTNTMTAISNNIGGMVANSMQLTATGVSSQVIGLVTQNAGTTATSNIIRNLTTNIGTGTGTTASVIGMSSTTTTPSHTFSQNFIFNLRNTNATAASTVTGIQFTGATANAIQRNLIYDLIVDSNSATAEVTGIRVAGGTTIYANNIIRIGNGIANAVQINGINELGGVDNFYHNSIYIGGAPTAGTANSFAFSSTVTASTRNFRDNIFFNARNNSGATGKNYVIRVGGTAPNPAGLTINNNVYFANGTGNVFGLFNALDVANLASWKTAVGQDANSFEVDPQFNNAIGAIPDLHLHPTNPTIAEGNGFDLGIAVDYDGETRSGLTPTDIGADAGNYVGLDLSGPAITYSVLPFICSTGDRSLNGVTILDNTGVPTVGANQPRIYYRKNAGTWFSSQGTLASGTSTNGTWNFSIIAADMGGLVLGDNVQYYVIAQDLAGSPNISSTPAGVVATDVNTVTTHPVTPNNYNISSSLGGTYTVGLTGNFVRLTDAVNAYNTSCLTGAVVFELLDATYPTETFPITINQNANASAINTLTIKPAVGITPTISGSLNGAIFVLNGADYVIINGSSTSGTAASCLVGGDAALRELTIQNTNVGTSAAVISVQSGTNGAMNNVIRNLKVVGQDPTTTLIGISLGGNAVGTAGTDNDNNVVENCSVQKAIFGIYSAGASLANQNSGTIIRQNDLSATGTNRIRRVGVLIFNDNGANVSYNSVSVDTNESADGIGIAMGVQAIDATSTTSGGITGALVSHNKINSIISSSTTGFSAVGISIAGASGAPNVIQNNMISGVTSPATSPDLTAGIYVVGVASADTRIYNNTVSMAGDRGAVATQMPSYAIAVTGTDPIVDLRNNIFNTSQTASGGGANAKAFAIGMVTTTFANLNSNYNNFNSSGAQDGGFRSGSLGVALGTDYATLALWSAAVSDDANSVEIAPVFVSATDLHLIPASNASLDNLGTPIAAVTTDYDCAVRSLTTPDMGADEFCSPTSNVTDIIACDTYTWAVNSTVYTTSGTYNYIVGCHTEVLNLTINITPNADAPANVTACDSYTLPALTVGNYFTGAGGTGTALVAGNTITSSQTIYVYAQTGTTPNCTDENSFTVTINNSPVADAPANVTACDSYTLPALTVGNYFTGIGGTGTALVAGNTITSSQTIYVYAQTGTTPNCTDENSFTVTINNSPVADAPANVTACDSYTLPALTVGNYFTGIGGTGTALVAGNTITSSQTIYVYAETGTTPNCTDENSFTVTINNSPVADAPANVTACDSYTLPALTVGNYFTGIGGTGTALVAGNTITSSQTIYVYAQTGTTPNCTDENSFTVTINNSPVADAPANVTACDSYTLPALTVGNYFTGAGGTGTALVAGNTITSSQTIYVYAQTGTTPNCTDENSFTVTITTSTSNSTTTSACNSYTWAVNGTTYTSSGTYTNVVGCHTETLNLTITTTTTPTGASTQVLNGGVAADVTIEDIVVSGTGIIWYPTLADAIANTNAIPAGTQLVDGEDYFAVSQNGICYSAALQVTVTVVLGNASFDLSQLNYYPNPVKDIFNVKYSKEIISIDVYDLTGRKVIEMKPNTLEVQMNMTNLSSAMYIVRLQSVDGITELKIYKN